MSFVDYLTSLQVQTEALVHNKTMEFASSLFDYVNPFACPLTIFEEAVLENRFLCCGFWAAYDWFFTKVETTCGVDTADKMEISREMLIPLMRERCPDNALGCRLILHLTLLGFIFWLCVLIWTAVVTLMWLRTRRQLRVALQSEESGKGQLAKLLPDAFKVELQPLKSAINRTQ